MNIEKLFYNGKCVMTVDMDYCKDDIMYEYLEEIVGIFKDKAFKEFDIDSKIELEIKKMWIGNEAIYELKNQVEEKLEQEYTDDPFEKVEQLFKIMEEKLNTEEFNIFKNIRNKEVDFYNESEINFYAGDGSMDYVWIEKNGRKDWRF